jgi:delta(3,5)-delta(2,4)-dienoyl-CoA isomerase
MWLNLSQIFNRLSHDPNIRSVILSGAGDRAFSAGLDVQAASEGQLSQDPSQDIARAANAMRRHILEFQDCISSIEKCEKPVIAILHGISFGLAMDMSLACDMRISTQDTKFSVKEVDIGLAADIGTLSRLPHAVGNQSWVKEISLTARIFGSDEALRFGLVSSVFKTKKEAVAEGLRLASLIGTKSPVAILGTKHLLNYSRGRPVAEGLDYTAVWNMAMVKTRDVTDALTSGLQKKTPKFSKL